MRRAAIDAVMRWRFEPAHLGGKPLTYFRPVELTFSGLPPESRGWVHRALFHVEAIVSDDELVVEEALRRVRAGEPFDKVAAPSRGLGPARGGDWGFVSAATLPAAGRKALHEARVGGLAGAGDARGLPPAPGKIAGRGGCGGVLQTGGCGFPRGGGGPPRPA